MEEARLKVEDPEHPSRGGVVTPGADAVRYLVAELVLPGTGELGHLADPEDRDRTVCGRRVSLNWTRTGTDFSHPGQLRNMCQVCIASWPTEGGGS